MPYTRTIDEKGILVTTLSGTVTLDDFIELEKTFPDYTHNGHAYEIVLHSPGTDISLDQAEASVSAAFFRNIVQDSLHISIAFVSDDPVLFGLCRQLQMRIENPSMEIFVFATESKARAWLEAKQQAEHPVAEPC